MAIQRSHVLLAINGFLLVVLYVASGARFSKDAHFMPDNQQAMPMPSSGQSIDPSHDPDPTHSGYLPIDEQGSELYYAYWEAEEVAGPDSGLAGRSTPIILWLQGGPGCASTFGGFYELGPYSLNEDLELVANSGG